MARGFKTGGRDFVAGDPRITHSKEKMVQEIKIIRQLTKNEFIGRFHKYCFMPKAKLLKMQYANQLDGMDHIFIRCILKSIAKGEYRFIQECIDQIIGKARQKVELEGPDGTPLIPTKKPDLSKIPLDVLKKLIEEKD